MSEQKIQKIFKKIVIIIICISLIIPFAYLILFSTSETTEGETLKNLLQRNAILTVSIGVIIILSIFLLIFILSFILKFVKKKDN